MQVISLDGDQALLSRADIATALPRPTSAQLLYVIYTSGSTGTPKGVMITHANLSDYLSGLKASLSIDCCRSFGLLSSIATDLGNTVLFSALAWGGCLHLFSKAAINDGDILADYFSTHDIDCIKIVPSHWKALSAERLLLPQQLLIFGGESLEVAVIDRIRSSGSRCTVVNHYGPTETTIGKLLHVVTDRDTYQHYVPIGKPFSDTKIYILNGSSQWCAAGAPGELYIGGAGVARGYLNNQVLTDERFIADPFSPGSGAKLYRTGDLVKYSPEGDIVFLGRSDDQVRIRGYRVELGEIARVLQQLEQVDQAVVTASGDNGSNRRLIGYVVVKPGFDREEAFLWLQERLPGYMVPSVLVELPHFPLLANGKIDRKSLPDREVPLSQQDYVAPVTAQEQEVAGIWSELLEVARVGLYDNFFSLGGHSLLAIRVISSIRKRLNLEVSIGEIFEYPTISSLLAQVNARSAFAVVPAVTAYERPGRIPLSYSQERLWFIDQLEGSVHYHIPHTLRLQGSLNREGLSYALQTIVNRHEVLRTVIVQESGIAYQQIQDKDSWQLEIIDVAAYREDETLLHACIESLIIRPFDLSADHMLRAHLIVLGAREHILVITLHHIASDAWSAGIIVKELAGFYNAYIEGVPAQLPLPAIQYADYAIWQRAYLSGALMEQKLAYWKDKLADITTLQLPVDYKRLVTQNSQGTVKRFGLGNNLSGQLKKLSDQEGATLFMTLVTALKVLLYRYCGQTDICIGCSTAGRQQQEVEELIGCFVNSLTLRSDLSNFPSFISLLQQVKTTTLEAYNHQDVPFEKVVDAVVKDRDISRNPLFQVMFVMQNVQDAPSLRLGDIIFSGEEVDHIAAKFDITFSITDKDDGLHISISYRRDLFNEATINRIGGHYIQLLQSIVKNPYQQVSVLQMLTASEEQQLLESFNEIAAGGSFRRDLTFLDLFFSQVQEVPDAVAIVFEDSVLTYKELDERSNQLAYYLHSQGVEKGALVPLCIERSLNMIVGILGILKAGGTYVPVDPDYLPQVERINYMLADTAATVILSSNASASKLSGITTANIILLDSNQTNISCLTPGAMPEMPAPDSLAYVIYTSGSTGKPKGVMITHANLFDYLSGLKATLPIDQCRSFGLLSSIATDLGNTVLFGALASGGSLHVLSKTAINDSDVMHRYLKRNPLDCIKIVPSHWKVLSEPGKLLLPVKLLIFGGEVLPYEIIADIRLSGSNCTIANHYGPTETTIGKLLHIVTDDLEYQQNIPIGKPFSDTRIYILNEAMQLCPVGVPGELYIGGAGVAQGYLNNQPLTGDRFIANPFSPVAKGRLYRTGDFVKYLPDGNIVFIGRRDDQVKIHGYRVELGEIESVLRQCDSVNQAVVLARRKNDANQSSNNLRLIAYVVPGKDFDREVMLSYLKSKLPEYMIPSLVITLEKMPLTANGKINKQALPDVDANEWTANAYIPPRNETEQKLIDICKEILEEDHIGMQDNFFKLGGDSILIIKLISRLRSTFNQSVNLADVYNAATMEQIAALINAASPVDNAAAEGEVKKVAAEITALKDSLLKNIPDASLIEDIYPMSDIQSGMVYAALKNPELGVYHNQAGYMLSKDLDVPVLEKALALMVQKHTILRTVFNSDLHMEGVQIVYKEMPVKIDYIDLSDNDNADAKRGIETYLEKERATPFKIGVDRLWRATVFNLQNSTAFLFQCHHAIIDGWSDASFNTELNNLYLSLKAQPVQPALPPLKCTYKDYVIENIAEKRNAANRAFWKNELHEYKRLDITSDKADQQRLLQTFDPAYLGELKRRTDRDNISLKGLFFGAFLYTLSMLTNEDDITLGLVANGRPLKEDGEKVLGCFLNTIPFRFKLDESLLTWEKYFEQIEKKLVEMKKRDRISLFEISRITGEQFLGENPFFDALFGFVNFHVYDNLDEGLSVLEDEELQGVMSYGDVNTNLNCNINITGNRAIIRYSLKRELKCGKSLLELHNYFDAVIRKYLHNYREPINRNEIIPVEELNQLKVVFNNTTVDYPSTAGKTVVDLFAEQALRTPDATAVVFAGKTLSYRELDERSNQLAHYLRNNGVLTEILVPICIERSLEMIIGIIGIMKAGGAYVPIDPDYPSERISHILTDTAAPLVISSNACKPFLENILRGADIIILDDDWPLINKHPITAKTSFPGPHHLAYVIYTSGSTGKPKGVMLAHRGLVNLALSQAAVFDLIPGMKTLQFSSFGFDASCSEIFVTLLSGGCLILPEKADLLSASRFNVLINKEAVDIITLPPSYQHIMKEALRNIKTIVSAGEALNREDGVYIQSQGVRLINAYGPTENTVCITMSDNPIRENNITIGKPIPNVRVYMRDKYGSLCPVGVPGEICVAGAGVAMGYLNQVGLTAEKFIQNPYCPDTYDRIYRTGDIGRWLPDGNIEYLGRLDEQVKIRGYRIELNEIEHVLQECSLVNQAIVVAKPDSSGQKRLIGFVVPNDDFDREAIFTYLRSRLPEYMVPLLLLELEKLPLTANGKIDKNALPDPDAGTLSAQMYVAPRNQTEQVLADIWQQLLEVDKVGVYDDFFQLGGHSLVAISAISKMNRLLHANLSLLDLFEHPVLASLAAILTEKIPEALDPMNKYWGLLNDKKDKHVMMFPPRLGQGLVYAQLSKLITSHSVYSFNYIDEENRLDIYLELIEKIQRKGPYILFGYSGGGHLAFEVAKELIKNGHQVSDIIIIDAVRRSNKKESGEIDKDKIRQEIEAAFEKNKLPAVDEDVMNGLVNDANGYSKYLFEIINDGTISANIHLIKNGETTGRISTYDWENSTTGNYLIYEGNGEHIEMLKASENLEHNATVIQQILDRIENSH
ncbi:non-ribosomal peptide synthetase [Chitinophaga niastensis]|uniref:non-ribosomal peptide synthetase n=1 Tax=Chitinophaga niastensis TaxID=536980 RepID=UPI000D0DA192